MATQVEETAIFESELEKVYEVVADVERYPEFIAHVTDVKRDGDIYEISIDGLGLPLGLSWTSKIVRIANEAILIQPIKGPWRYFEGAWYFEPVPEGTKVTYAGRFKLNIPVPGLRVLVRQALITSIARSVKAFKERLGEGDL